MNTSFTKISYLGKLFITLLISLRSFGAEYNCPQGVLGQTKVSEVCTLIKPASEVPNAIVFCSQMGVNKKVDALMLFWTNRTPLIGAYVENDNLIPGAQEFAFVSKKLKLFFSSSTNLQTKENFVTLNTNQNSYLYRCQK